MDVEVRKTVRRGEQRPDGQAARNFDVQLVEHPLASLGLHGMSCPGLEDDDARKVTERESAGGRRGSDETSAVSIRPWDAVAVATDRLQRGQRLRSNLKRGQLLTDLQLEDVDLFPGFFAACLQKRQ